MNKTEQHSSQTEDRREDASQWASPGRELNRSGLAQIGDLPRRVSWSMHRGIGWGELWHPPQAIGRCFDPSNLGGYFNDLTGKADYRGPVDSDGIPLAQGPRHRLFYHPTMVCQKALGHYDGWLLNATGRDADNFIRASRWLVRTQDPRGGWPCIQLNPLEADGEPPIGAPTRWFDFASPYSGMVQGQAVSVLVRAAALTGEEAFRDAAHRAFGLMTHEVSDGGVCEVADDLVSIEEVPSRPRNTILNGWIFGIFGVWDYWLDTGSPTALEFFTANVASLLHRLGTWNLGWWSLYDEQGRVAKPFYHHLHLAQLAALAQVKADARLARTIQIWTACDTNTNRTKALLAYIFQRFTGTVLTRPIRVGRLEGESSCGRGA